MVVRVLDPSEIDLLVNVSVVALPTNVSVAAGSVRVPEATADATREVVPEDEPVKLMPADPITGVTSVGDEANTAEPLPVSSLIAVAI